MLQAALAEIDKTKNEIGNKPAQALQIITFLNGKNKEELEELKIPDRTEAILQVKKVMTKRNIMNNLEEKCETMNFSISKFKSKYEFLLGAGLPDIHGFNEKLLIQKDYDNKIRTHAKEQAKKTLPQGSPSGKVVLEYFENLFFLKYEIKHMFVVKPNFYKYTEADESYRKLRTMKIPSPQQWKEFIDLL